MSTRVYVEVAVVFTGEGRMLPRVIRWEDGTQYKIDRVTDVRQAPAPRSGGQGDRYTVLIHGRERYPAAS